MSLSNDHALQNTALLRLYADCDPRVRSLVVIVKVWAKRRGISNARNCTLTSYAWTILVISFLQQTDPPVVTSIPCDNIPAEFTYLSANTDCVGRLLFQFFAYYNNRGPRKFKVFQDIICIRPEGDPSASLSATAEKIQNIGKVDKAAHTDQADDALSTLASKRPWWRMSIQDPIDLTRDLCDVIHRHEGQQLILTELHRGLEIMCSYLRDDRSTADEDLALLQRLCAQNEDIPSLPPICKDCGSEDHTYRECPSARCSGCGGRGHNWKDCDKKICHRCKTQHKSEDACPMKSYASALGSSLPPSELLSRLPMPAYADSVETDDWDSVLPRGSEVLKSELLTWSLGEVCNERLLNSRLAPIPLVFESPKHWFGAFYPGLLEEVRAQVAQLLRKGLQDIPKVKFSLTREQRKGAIGSGACVIEINLPDWAVLEESVREALNSTLVLAVRRGDPAQADIDALKHLEHAFCFLGWNVRKEGFSDDSKEVWPHIFHAELPRLSELESSFQGDQKTDWDLYLLQHSLTAPLRICDGLQRAAGPHFMRDIVHGTSERVELPMEFKSDAGFIEYFGDQLNDSQREALAAIIAACNKGAPPIQLIKGPPGKLQRITFPSDALIS